MTLSQDARALLTAVNKELGTNALVLASDLVITSRFPSGSLSLDVALGGGWPTNQWHEVIGPESAGKTALTLKTIAVNQRRNPEFTTLWVAAEHYDVDQAGALGVDNDRVLVYSTLNTEEAFEVMLTAQKSASVDCIVLDSYPALVPEEEITKDMDQAVVAIGARLMGKFFRKSNPLMRNTERPILGLIINQWRDQIGGWSPQGTPQTSPGGKAKNYAYYVRIELKRVEWIEEALPGKNMKVKVGQTIRGTTIKNKSAAPRQVASIDFYFRDTPSGMFERGDYDDVKELKMMCLLYDVIVRKGAFFEYETGPRTQDGALVYRWKGKDETDLALRSDLDLQDILRTEVLRIAALAGRSKQVSDEDIASAKSAGTKTISRKKVDIK